MTDLERAFDALKNKKSGYDQLFGYYDGKQPLVYLAKRLEEIFKDLTAYFAENWASVVVDSCRDRVNLREVQVPGGQQAAWKEIWEGSELALESDEVHEAAMVAGEGFVIAWPGEEGKAEAYANDPRLVHVFYNPEYPRQKEYAAKWWVDADNKLRMTLYYPDRLEYYQSKNKAENVSSAKALYKMDQEGADNPYGEVPVFHFRLGARRVKSDLRNVVPVQNAINKLLTDMMVTAEFGAFPQRYVISTAEVQGKLKNAPNEVWDLPAGDGMGQQTMAGQFAAASLENYLKAIDNLATAISSITRTPKHYFFSIGSNLSGEALIAMEAPLNKKAQDRIDRFTPVWQDVARFLLKIGGADISAREVTPIWDRPETVQPKTMAEARQMNTQAGMPLATVLREEGKSKQFIEQMMKDKQAEQEANRLSLGQAMVDAQRQFDQGGGNNQNV